MQIVIDIPEEKYDVIKSDLYNTFSTEMKEWGLEAIRNGAPLTPSVLADMLMEERIRGELDYDTSFEKDIIRDVKCILTVRIRDHRPCYCGAELREVWRKRKENSEGV